MPLSFDPAAILAPGGIASGLDNLGAAIVSAMNRRAERQSQKAAQAQSRSEHLADILSERTFQSSEAAKARQDQAAREDQRLGAEQQSQADQRDAQFGREAGTEEQKLEEEVLSDPRLIRRETGKRTTTGIARVNQTTIDEMEGLSPDEIQAEIARRRSRVQGLADRWGNRVTLPGRFEAQAQEWLTAPKPPEVSKQEQAASPPTRATMFEDTPERTKRIAELTKILGASPSSNADANIFGRIVGSTGRYNDRTQELADRMTQRGNAMLTDSLQRRAGPAPAAPAAPPSQVAQPNMVAQRGAELRARLQAAYPGQDWSGYTDEQLIARYGMDDDQ